LIFFDDEYLGHDKINADENRDRFWLNQRREYFLFCIVGTTATADAIPAKDSNNITNEIIFTKKEIEFHTN
jgi:hypothetical protein